jgi:peptide/nickel transport system permease protein
MILEARPLVTTAPWTAVFPGAAIALTVLAVNLIGDALQSALDPRSA